MKLRFLQDKKGIKLKTNLLFGIHCHQPIDNFDKVIYEIIEKSYRPFFETLQSFPQFKCSVHFSGWLFEYIKKNDPKLFSLIKSLSSQIEFFTGGYYEPILASIPSSSRVKQINKLSRFIEDNFNQSPKGLWLTERIWDDSIIDDLNECNIEYVIVDDYHLIASGFEKNKLNGYFLTENSNNSIAFFPINKDLRYIIPFASLDNTMETLHKFKNKEGENAAIIFDDGEKFGVWPKTYEKVYEKQWLKNFFTKCIEDENIEISTFKEYYEKNKAISLAYLPTVSYHEMGEWSVLRNIQNDYLDLVKQNMHREYLIRGGIWKNFFIKYFESNWIHKRSIELSKNENKSLEFEEALFKTQCNDVLWHGVFGGIYLPNLRDNAYKYIIECENILGHEKASKAFDIDLDSQLEYKFYTPKLLAIIDIFGAQLVEFDLRDKLFNLQNTLTRYHESYHDKIEKKDEELSELENSDKQKLDNDEIETIHSSTLVTNEEIELVEDWYNKSSAIDHICDKNITLEEFRKCKFAEYADFANQDFEVKNFEEDSICLKRDGGIYINNEKFPSTITKEFSFLNNKVKLDTKINSENISTLNYLTEWNFHFMDYEVLNINGHIFEDDSLFLENSRLTIIDPSLNKTIIFLFDQCMQMYIYKVKSVSQSEEGVDYTTQGICFGFACEFKKELHLKTEISIS